MEMFRSAFDSDDDYAADVVSKPDAAGVFGGAGSSDAAVQPAVAVCVDSPSTSEVSRLHAAPAPALAEAAAPDKLSTPGKAAVPAAPLQSRQFHGASAVALQSPATSAAPELDVAQADVPAHAVAAASAGKDCAVSKLLYAPEVHDLEWSDDEECAAAPLSAAPLSPAPSQSHVPSDADTSDFEHGECDHTLTSGRYGKIEGRLFGSHQIGGLTMHTKFEAAATASSGYKTLERGMWVDCPGIPWTETQLVRIASGNVSASSSGKSKAQKKYAALLLVPLGSFEDPVDRSKDEWYYAPLQKVQPLDGPEDVSGGPLFHRSGKRKRMFNCDRHGADVCLDAWVPQSISTLARKAGGLTARKSRKPAE